MDTAVYNIISVSVGSHLRSVMDEDEKNEKINMMKIIDR